MSFDPLRNAQELGEGYPLYRAVGDIQAEATVTAIGGDIIAPQTDVITPFDLESSRSPLSKQFKWLLIAVIAFLILYYLYRRYH